jgi:hypothetical protein
MKKLTAVLLTAVLAALICSSCVTKNKNNYENYERDRNAAVDAAGRMENAGN